MVPGTVKRAHTGHKDEGSDGTLVKLSQPSLGAPLPNYQTPLHKCSILIVTEVGKLTLECMHRLQCHKTRHTEENFLSYTLLIKFPADTPAILISNSTRSTRGEKKHRLKKGTEIKTDAADE